MRFRRDTIHTRRITTFDFDISTFRMLKYTYYMYEPHTQIALWIRNQIHIYLCGASNRIEKSHFVQINGKKKLYMCKCVYARKRRNQRVCQNFIIRISSYIYNLYIVIWWWWCCFKSNRIYIYSNINMSFCRVW